MAEISVILYDSSLQSVSEFPESFLQHNAIQNDAIREGHPAEQLIVDLARHYPAVRELQLSDHLKIGRPDIVHISLLTMLHHPLMGIGALRTYVHTLGNQWFRIPSNWRIPVNYVRFIGLMRQFLSSKRIPDSGRAILELNDGNLTHLIESEDLQARKILLSFSGPLTSIGDLALKVFKSGAVLLIGGFQKGKPSRLALDIADEICSIYPQPMTSWTTLSLLMTALLLHREL
ncbi:MAG: hypothetical protein ACFFB3_11100 [Candidatus Hodarchaeota archaeon]